MIRSLILLFAFAPLLSSFVYADAELVHSPEYSPGKVIRSEVDLEVAQTLTIAGMPVETANETYVVVEEKVKETDANQTVLDGNIVVMQSNISLPGGQGFNFDSGNPDADLPAGPLAEVGKFFKALSKATWVSTLDSKGYVKDVDYDDAFENEVPEAFKNEISLEKRQNEQKQIIDKLPGKSVAVGETWDRNEEANLGSGQKFYFEREYKYEGPSEDDENIHVVSFTTKSVEFGVEGNALPLEIKDSDLQVKSSKGKFLYSTEKKAITEIDDEIHIVGKLTLVANGMELPSELDLTMHGITKISSK